MLLVWCFYPGVVGQASRGSTTLVPCSLRYFLDYLHGQWCHILQIQFLLGEVFSYYTSEARYHTWIETHPKLVVLIQQAHYLGFEECATDTRVGALQSKIIFTQPPETATPARCSSGPASLPIKPRAPSSRHAVVCSVCTVFSSSIGWRCLRCRGSQL